MTTNKREKVTFTPEQQKEVNRIVKERLAREKRKHEKELLKLHLLRVNQLEERDSD